MVAFTYRMGAGFPGGVNRIHASMIEPCLLDPNSTAVAFGSGVIADDTTTEGVRAPTAADTSAICYGVAVRPFPIQQNSGGMAASFGTGNAPGPIVDILKTGYIFVQVSGGGSPKKGDPVYLWVAASTGSHVQGGFENSATGGSTVAVGALPNTYWNGPADASGVAEIAFNL